MKAVLLMLPIFVIACGASPPEAPLQANRAASIVRICAADDADARPSDAEIQALGAPDSETRFPITDDVSEFRVRLLNHSLARDGSAEVREATWNEGDCRLTLWSVRQGANWRIIEWLRWTEGDQF